jgi:hypothetical protein
MLGHIMHVLRMSSAWPVPGPDASRKLSTLRFVAGSFQRHLEHLFALEENDGFIDLVLATAPWLGRRTDALKAQHVGFRTEARQLVQKLQGLPPTDIAALNAACAGMLNLLGRIEEHNGKEIALLQEALERVDGGEG